MVLYILDGDLLYSALLVYDQKISIRDLTHAKN